MNLLHGSAPSDVLITRTRQRCPVNDKLYIDIIIGALYCSLFVVVVIVVVVAIRDLFFCSSFVGGTIEAGNE